MSYYESDYGFDMDVANIGGRKASVGPNMTTNASLNSWTIYMGS